MTDADRDAYLSELSTERLRLLRDVLETIREAGVILRSIDPERFARLFRDADGLRGLCSSITPTEDFRTFRLETLSCDPANWPDGDLIEVLRWLPCLSAPVTVDAEVDTHGFSVILLTLGSDADACLFLLRWV